MPAAAGRAVAGLVSHLHRDHTDAGALAAALAPGAAVHHPVAAEERPNLALAQAEHELGASGAAAPRGRQPGSRSTRARSPARRCPPWTGSATRRSSWLVEAGGRRVLHLGDTVFHGAWWQMARRAGPFDVVLAPINGALVDFPHQQPASPLPAAMEPEQAALAGELLGAGTVVPMHYGGYAIDPYYRPIADARERFERAARGRPFRSAPVAVGETL